MNSDIDPFTLDEREQRRLHCLRSLQILDTPADPALDAVTAALAERLGVPIALVSLVDERRQWFKSRHGLEATETPREWALCAHAIAGEGVMVVEDASLDPRFSANPLIVGNPNIRFYAGAPLRVNGEAIGTLCVIDSKPRTLTASERETMVSMAGWVQASIESRAAQRRAALSEVRLADMVRASTDFLWETDAKLNLSWLSDDVERVMGVASRALLGTSLWHGLLRGAPGPAQAAWPLLGQGRATGSTPQRLLVEVPAALARTLLLSAVPVFGADGTHLGWRGTATDIAALQGGGPGLLAAASPRAPLADEGGAASAAKPQPADPGPAVARRRAVYAEDNPVNALLLQAMFELRSDWQLDCVEDGQQLMTAVRARHYDLVLLDIHLGSESGLDLVGRLRADSALRHLNCIALSADGQRDQIEAGLRAGFDDYWTKPIAMSTLNLRLNSLAASPAAQRQADRRPG